ncbi:MAG: hypothetical protein LKG27_00220 [Clostridiaceae bacterium]|jgi:hypothetical protein|nr:hypothetical protein [Clostridiaceae bacterium]
MEEIKTYNLTEKEFKNLEKLVEKIYNTLIVLNYFCINQQELEAFYTISPIIENLKQNADILNLFFINYGVKED